MFYRSSKGIQVFLCLILVFTQDLLSQNLIINPGFEDANRCEYNSLCSPSGWYSTVNGSVLGYFGKNAKRRAHQGDRFLSIILLNKSTDNREYLMTPLKCQLNKGEKYTLRLYLRPGSYKLNSFGALFTDVPVNTGYISALSRKGPSSPPLESNPQVSFDEKELLKLKKNWNKIEASFIATGNEKYMTIGAFKSREEIIYKKIRKNGPGSSNMAFSIDDVELIPESGRICNADSFVHEVYTDNYRHPYSNLFFKSFSKASDSDSNSFEPLIVEPEIGDTILLENILFKTSSSDLLSESFTELEKLVSLLRRNPEMEIQIIGHTDAEGTPENNQILSENRALSVIKYVRSKGINNTIQAIGLGQFSPVSDNSSPEGKRKNRRVEFIIIKK